MRVRAVAPIRVTDEELERRQRRYWRMAPPEVTVDLVNLDGEAAPTQLNTREDIALSDRLVLEEAQRTDPDTYDVVLPDCVLDPAVDGSDSAPVPIVGILDLTAHLLAGAGHRFSAVTRNEAIGDELVARVEHYGLGDVFAGLDVLQLDFEAIADDARWHEALSPVRRTAEERGVRAIINGCSAVEVPADDEIDVVLVDPTRLALELLGVSARSGMLGGTS